MGSRPSDLCGSRVSYGGLPTSLSRFPVFLEVQQPLSYFFEDIGLFYLPSSSQSLLSSLLRYIQPYGRATITFSFRQFSLFLLHQSHSFTVMQFSALCCRQNRVNLAESRTDDPLGRTHLETKIAGLVRVALCSQS